MKFIKTIMTVIAVVIVSCSNLQKIYRYKGVRTEIFPPGIYQHQVTVILKDGNENRFDGVVKKTKEGISVVGLSSFASTIFKIQESFLTKKVELEIYHEALKPHRARILSFYQNLSKVLNQKNKEGSGIRFGSLDSHEIPEEFEILRPEFTVRVKVVGYEVGNGPTGIE